MNATPIHRLVDESVDDQRERDCSGPGDDDADDDGQRRADDARRKLRREDVSTCAEHDETSDVGDAESSDDPRRCPPGERTAGDVVSVCEVREVQNAVRHRETDAGETDDQAVDDATPDENE
jgi:hypothetical protein